MPDAQWSGLSEASYQVAREFNWDKSAELLEDYLHRLLAGQTVAAC
jgi:hypothetical protein